MSTTPARVARSRPRLQLAGVLTFTSLAALLAITACAQASGGKGGQADPGAPNSGMVSSGPLPSGGASLASPAPNAVSPEPAVDLRRERWSRVEAVGKGADVLVHGTLTGGPPCAVLGRVEVAETPKQVTITLWVGRRANAKCDGRQPQMAYPFVTRVALDAPLGNREVRDGAA
jgi:hypothetical protein